MSSSRMIGTSRPEMMRRVCLLEKSLGVAMVGLLSCIPISGLRTLELDMCSTTADALVCCFFFGLLSSAELALRFFSDMMGAGEADGNV